MNIDELTFEELVALAKHTDDSISAFEEQKKNLDEAITLAQEQRVKVYARLLSLAKSKNLTDEKVNELFVTYFSKENVTWLDDAGLLAALKKNKATEFIKVVVTTKESIDKTALKKAFKNNEVLKETYKTYYGTKLTEYVTVTTEENHTKMLGHIEEGKAKDDA